MKKQLLLSALAIAMSGFASAQDFTQTNDNTGFVYNCDLNETGAPGALYGWTTWNPTCAYNGNTGSGSVDDTKSNSYLALGFGQSTNGFAYFIFTLNTPLDLSNTANQKISMTLSNVDGNGNALPLPYAIHLESSDGATLTDSIVANVTGTPTLFNLDFSSKVKSGKNLSSVDKIVIVYSACSGGTVQAASSLLLSNFEAGSQVTGVKSVQQLIAKAKLYPNPATDLVNVEMDLKSNSAVRLILNDIMGKEVRVLTEGNFTNLEYAFTTSDLTKGMYTLTYVINGVPARTDLFMVK